MKYLKCERKRLSELLQAINIPMNESDLNTELITILFCKETKTYWAIFIQK